MAAFVLKNDLKLAADLRDFHNADISKACAKTTLLLDRPLNVFFAVSFLFSILSEISIAYVILLILTNISDQ